MDTVALPRLYTVRAVAEWLDLSTRRVHDLVNSGEIRSVRIGGRIRIPESALQEIVSARCTVNFETDGGTDA